MATPSRILLYNLRSFSLSLFSKSRPLLSQIHPAVPAAESNLSRFIIQNLCREQQNSNQLHQLPVWFDRARTTIVDQPLFTRHSDISDLDISGGDEFDSSDEEFDDELEDEVIDSMDRDEFMPESDDDDDADWEDEAIVKKVRTRGDRD